MHMHRDNDINTSWQKPWGSQDHTSSYSSCQQILTNNFGMLKIEVQILLLLTVTMHSHPV